MEVSFFFVRVIGDIAQRRVLCYNCAIKICIA